MTFAAVDVTLRVGARVGRTAAAPHVDLPRGGGLPVTGGSFVTLLVAALAMLVLGTLLVLHVGQEQR